MTTTGKQLKDLGYTKTSNWRDIEENKSYDFKCITMGAKKGFVEIREKRGVTTTTLLKTY